MAVEFRTDTKSDSAPEMTADEMVLATLGYKQELRREFTIFEVFGVVFSIMGLFSGITSVLFYTVPNGGPVGMVWGWLVASVFILTIGLSMAELASAAPTSGGLYFWTYKYSSPETRNLLCWFVGYVNTMGNIAGVASMEWGCAVQVMAAATLGSVDQSYVPAAYQTYLVYVAIIISHALLIAFATPTLARLQNLYIVFNIGLCFAVMIILPITTPKSLKNDASFALGNFTNLSGWPNAFAFTLSWIAPAWVVGGFDSSVHISEEATNAATAVPYAIIGAIITTGILGTAANIALTFCSGTDMDGIFHNKIDQPMATIIFNSVGYRGTLALWSVIVLVQYMMGSSMLLAASRQAFAFSRDGALPFSRYLYRVNPKTKTPVNTVWFAAIMAILLALLTFAGPSATNALFSLNVIGNYLAYTIPISVRFIFSRNTFKSGPFSLGRWSPLIAIIAVAFMTFSIIIFCFPATPTTDTADMNYSVVVASSVIICSLIWYYFPRFGGIHWFKGPVRTVGDKKQEKASSDTSDEDEKIVL